MMVYQSAIVHMLYFERELSGVIINKTYLLYVLIIFLLMLCYISLPFTPHIPLTDSDKSHVNNVDPEGTPQRVTLTVPVSG